MRTPFFYIILCVTSLLASCVKDKPNPDTKSFPTNLSHGVVVLNEGSFGNNNSDISYINLENQIVSNSLFKIVNGHSLGDVAQFITLINGTYYVCINNSNKIVVLDTADFSLRANHSHHRLSSLHGTILPRYRFCFEPIQTVCIGSTTIDQHLCGYHSHRAFQYRTNVDCQ
jgi:hypothetical protein